MVEMMSNDERLQWWIDHPSTAVAENYTYAGVRMPLGMYSIMSIEESVMLDVSLSDTSQRDVIDDHGIEDAAVYLVLGVEPLSVDPWDSWEDLVQGIDPIDDLTPAVCSTSLDSVPRIPILRDGALFA
ncbi:MAG: hypothetical protein ACKPKO_48125, partial [Candidatus Fonsibacter sp.]